MNQIPPPTPARAPRHTPVPLPLRALVAIPTCGPQRMAVRALGRADFELGVVDCCHSAKRGVPPGHTRPDADLLARANRLGPVDAVVLSLGPCTCADTPPGTAEAMLLRMFDAAATVFERGGRGGRIVVIDDVSPPDRGVRDDRAAAEKQNRVVSLVRAQCARLLAANVSVNVLSLGARPRVMGGMTGRGRTRVAAEMLEYLANPEGPAITGQWFSLRPVAPPRRRLGSNELSVADAVAVRP